jgi:glucose uptake protein
LVLPGTATSALLLILVSISCFGLWPNIFKLAGSKARFELFSMDFAVGALLFSLVAAYTLGTLGADLGFSDSMLVAGQRAQAMAVIAGVAFAFGNMCFLAAIALLGQANASLLTFGAFGAALSLLRLNHPHFVQFTAAFVCLLFTCAFAFASARNKRQPPGRVIKGFVMGLLAGLGFVSVLPVLSLAQPDQLGVGPNAGMLLAGVGILVATFSLNFFFLNMSLEGPAVGYGTYFSARAKDHLVGVLGGVAWATGALALYAAYTGTVQLPSPEAWLAPFGGAVIAVFTGLFIWQKLPQPPRAKQLTITAIVCFLVGVTLLVTKV